MQRGKPVSKKGNKELRKPISGDFDPKRLAINFQPPMIIMEYLVIDTGKLYHHKMRLDSILRKPNVQRQDVLNYIKTKHHLYFLNGKIKDQLLLKFIDKILIKMGKMKHPAFINKNIDNFATGNTGNIGKTLITQNKERIGPADDDFDYLNDDEQYEQDYQDYEQDRVQLKQPFKEYKNLQQKLEQKQQKVETAKNANKNAFLTYCQEYERQEEEAEQAEWDLDMDQNADFV